MEVEQKLWKAHSGWATVTDKNLGLKAQIVLVFGGRKKLQEEGTYSEIKKMYPSSDIVLCSTAGEIANNEVHDESLVVTAIFFSKTNIKFSTTTIRGAQESHDAGVKLAQQLSNEGLTHVLVFSDGLKVNGTALVEGLVKILPPQVSVTGGLVGDGADFKQTVVGLNQVPQEGMIVLIGLYGLDLKIGYGSLGGWDSFGPERLITKSKGNVLFELDGTPALELYKRYLGDKAKDLPGSGLLFPLMVRMKSAKGNIDVVRTILGIDEKEQNMTFAGDVPQGMYAKLMKANFERLIDGAAGAAARSTEPLGSTKPDFALLISCIGRKLVLKERVEEEIEAVREVVGKDALITGFYSYGEICPTSALEKQCQLHNQTMTITTFRE